MHIDGMKGALARPIATKTLRVETVGTTSSTAEHSERSASALHRAATLAAVQQDGGHAAGARLSDREHCRRMLLSLRWQAAVLAAAAADVSMLFADLAGAPHSLVLAVTALVLGLFCIDVLLRTFAYRRLLLRSAWFWFDVAVLVASLVGFALSVGAEARAARAVAFSLGRHKWPILTRASVRRSRTT